MGSGLVCETMSSMHAWTLGPYIFYNASVCLVKHSVHNYNAALAQPGGGGGGGGGRSSFGLTNLNTEL